MQAETTFIKNKLYVHLQVILWIRSSRHKKHGSKKEKTEKPTPMKTEQTCNGLWLLLDVDF
jgi:hypothetical protein